MALVNSRGLLRDARANGYAVGAFNVENMEMAKAVIAAAEEMRSPVMLQTTPSTVDYGLFIYILPKVLSDVHVRKHLLLPVWQLHP